MAMQDDLKAELIKQFAANVIFMTDGDASQYYACPTCKRKVAMSNSKCLTCGQMLNWDYVRQEEYKISGIKKAKLTFEVPGNFVKSDCRKCPLSYITKSGDNNIYECPLGMRNNCELEIE